QERMNIRVTLKAIGFFLMVVIGIPGNFTILAVFALIKLSNGKLLSTDIILTKLAFVNLLIVLVKGIPQAFTAIGIRKLFNDNGCRAVLLLYRVSRALSICMTALLSCYQSIIIAPSSNRWRALKQKMPQKLVFIMIILWCVNIFIYSWTLSFSFAQLNSTTTEYTLNLEFCFVVFPSFQFYIGNGTLYLFRDFLFVGLMVLASGYIVFILYQHRKQVKGIRSSDRGQETRAETRAAKAVVMLVALYVILFGLDNIIWIYTLQLSKVAPEISDARVFFASCYSAISPILIIATNKKIQTARNIPNVSSHSKLLRNILL
uniref:Vomeronasal type-1 receptor n=1 Tax=Latimeria chalumnae TaxID=7897 RepID=H3BH68_LATCH